MSAQNEQSDKYQRRYFQESILKTLCDYLQIQDHRLRQ